MFQEGVFESSWESYWLIGSLVKSVKSKGYTETPEMATFDSEYQEKFVTSLTLTCQKKQENS